MVDPMSKMSSPGDVCRSMSCDEFDADANDRQASRTRGMLERRIRAAQGGSPGVEASPVRAGKVGRPHAYVGDRLMTATVLGGPG